MRPRGLGAYLAPKRVKLPNAKVGASPVQLMSQVSAEIRRFHPQGCSHGALPRCRQALQYPSGAMEVLERQNPSRTVQQPTFRPSDHQYLLNQQRTMHCISKVLPTSIILLTLRLQRRQELDMRTQCTALANSWPTSVILWTLRLQRRRGLDMRTHTLLARHENTIHSNTLTAWTCTTRMLSGHLTLCCSG